MNIKSNTNTRIIRRGEEKKKEEFTCFKKTYRIYKESQYAAECTCVNVYLIYNVKSLSAVYWKK